MQRIILALALTLVAVLYVEPAVRQQASSIDAPKTVAQRYPLRSRSKSFYDRSKISNARSR